MADYTEKMQEARNEVDGAIESFMKSRDRLKGELKNDAASVSSAANKMHAEMEKVRRSVIELSQLMNSAEMMAAVVNAERLAAALGAINALQSHKITFAVIDGGLDARAD